jgi:hypothetical protein
MTDRLTLLLILAAGLPVLAAPAPSEKLSPARLADLFLTNEAAADESYVGKQVEVTGQVVRVSRSPHAPHPDTGPNYVLELDQGRAGRGEPGDVRVLFNFKNESRGELAKLKPGQTVGVRGRCDQRRVWAVQPGRADREYSEVHLPDCALVSEK